MKIFLTLVFSCILLGAGAQEKGKSINIPQLIGGMRVYFGVASFYSDKFVGRKTSSGELYETEKYTAACNLLPLGTWIRVTNTRNQESVIVRINDRLHPKNKRILDLSKVAATRLRYVGTGLTQVKVEVLGKIRPPEEVVLNK